MEPITKGQIMQCARILVVVGLITGIFWAYMKGQSDATTAMAAPKVPLEVGDGPSTTPSAPMKTIADEPYKSQIHPVMLGGPSGARPVRWQTTTDYKDPFVQICPECGRPMTFGYAKCASCGAVSRLVDPPKISCLACKGTGKVICTDGYVRVALEHGMVLKQFTHNGKRFYTACDGHPNRPYLIYGLFDERTTDRPTHCTSCNGTGEVTCYVCRGTGIQPVHLR